MDVSNGLVVGPGPRRGHGVDYGASVLARRRPMSQLAEEAADALERRVFFDQLSSRYEALRANPTAWSEIEAERTIESGTLSDRSS